MLASVSCDIDVVVVGVIKLLGSFELLLSKLKSSSKPNAAAVVEVVVWVAGVCCGDVNAVEELDESCWCC